MRSLNAAVQRVLGRANHLPASLTRVARLPTLLGAVLLVSSATAVLATQNTPVAITSATVSKTVVNEGEPLTLNVRFADPDITDGHSVYVVWRFDSRDWKIRLPIGQRDFQINHAFRDDKDSYGYEMGEIYLTVMDHQLPFGTNDNASGKTYDHESIQVQVRNVPPNFTKVSASESRPQPTQAVVKIDGIIVDPGVLDTHQVTAAPGSPDQRIRGMPCTVNAADRRFHCELMFNVPEKFSVTKTITLQARDDDGGQGVTTMEVELSPRNGPNS